MKIARRINKYSKKKYTKFPGFMIDHYF